MTIVREICSILKRVKKPIVDTAPAFHDFVESELRNHGLYVRREVWTPENCGISGRYDLVVFDECNCAIEIDRRMVRAKSVQKLLSYNGGRIAILRGGKPPHDIVGIDATLWLPALIGGL
jgi:hypothetical protein